MKPDPRHIAFELLLSSRPLKNTLDQAIDQAGEKLAGLSSRDRTLCNAIVFGVLRHQGMLDHLIGCFSDRVLDKLDAAVLLILRIGAFQICFLDRVPDFAAINTSIDLAKLRLNRKTSGFINAVLRKLAAGHKDAALPDKEKQFLAFLRVSYSIPTWLGKRWMGGYGKEKTESLCKSLMDIPSITLRANPLKIRRSDLIALLNKEDIQTRQTQISPLGIHISHPGRSLADLPGFDQGYFQVQDQAAQLVTQVLGPKPGERVLDACAGLGGKTCHMAQLMENQGQITAVDIEPEKLERMKTEASRLGISIIQTHGLNIMGSTIKNFGGFFDKVLVDAPCTGLGVLRRNPDTRWKRKMQDILRMAAQQKKILNAAANLVRPGGILVFAVCSCEPDENERVIQTFLSKRKDFSGDSKGIEDLDGKLPGISPGDFTLKTFPEPGTMDGFFVARMRRKDKA